MRGGRRMSRTGSSIGNCGLRSSDCGSGCGLHSEIRTPKSEIRSSPEQVDLVYVDGDLVAEDGDDDGEADGGLGGGYAHHEEHQDMPGDVAEGLAERHQREVHRVQHQLDGEEDHDGVPAQQHAEHADREEHRAEREVPVEREVHGGGQWSVVRGPWWGAFIAATDNGPRTTDIKRTASWRGARRRWWRRGGARR